MGKLKFAAAAAIAASAFVATSANAAQTLVITGASGTYGDDSVVATGCATGSPSPCNFSRTFTFVTPDGFNNVSLDISSVLNGAGTNIDFTSVLFNGTQFNILSTGTQEFRNLLNRTIAAGATNTISIFGTTDGVDGVRNASFTGNLAFSNVQAAVPEPATWGLMLLGFGAVGFSMRRRRQGALLTQAA